MKILFVFFFVFFFGFSIEIISDRQNWAMVLHDLLLVLQFIQDRHKKETARSKSRDEVGDIS